MTLRQESDIYSRYTNYFEYIIIVLGKICYRKIYMHWKAKGIRKGVEEDL